jgi:transposase
MTVVSRAPTELRQRPAAEVYLGTVRRTLYILENGQPWTPQQIPAFIEDRYGVTYHPTHLSRKLREAVMNYTKPQSITSTDSRSRPVGVESV